MKSVRRFFTVLVLLAVMLAAGQMFHSTRAAANRTAGEDNALPIASQASDFVQVAKLVALDGAAGDGFGNGVAIDGDVIAVGAQSENGGQGAVYVFVKPAGGWQMASTYAAKLIPSDVAAGDYFGAPIAMHGDTIVVGAHTADIGGNSNQGAAWVFVKPAGGWSGTVAESAKLTALGGVADDLFGVQAAMNESGDVIVIGGHHVDGSRGGAFVFVKPAGGWNGNLNENARLSVSDGASGDFFGRGLGISGDTVAVGAYGANGGSGRAYVFLKPAGGWTGTVSESAQLNPSQGNFGEFGNVVNIKGDTVVAGTYPGTGAAYVYVKPAGGWAGSLTEDARLTASDGEGGDFFAYNSIALGDNQIAVGAHQDDVGANGDQGTVYLFDKPAGGWSGNLTETYRLNASDGASGDWFGLTMAMSGENIVISAHLSDIGANPDQGAAYIFSAPQPTASEQLSELISMIQALPQLNSGQKNSLVVKLDGARNALDKGKTNAACGKLGAFINEVQALVKTGRLDTAVGNDLIARAHAIESLVGCP